MRKHVELELARRALSNLQNGTTDQAHDVMELPVSAYTDEGRYRRETRRLFHQLPQAVAR